MESYFIGELLFLMGLLSRATYYLIRGYNSYVLNRLKSWLSQGWRRRWRRAHLAFSPVGVLITTGLLSRSAGVWGWNDRESLTFFADLVPLGVVVYAAAVLMMEWVIRMVFWALAQREKDIANRRAEGRAQGLAEGRAQGQAEGRAQGQAEGRAQVIEQVLMNLGAQGIQVPAGGISSEPVGRNGVLLENGDVYASQSLNAYIGRINRDGLDVLAQLGKPPELPGIWCQRGWRVQLDRHFEELLFVGRVQGLRLDTSSSEWLVGPC